MHTQANIKSLLIKVFSWNRRVMRTVCIPFPFNLISLFNHFQWSSCLMNMHSYRYSGRKLRNGALDWQLWAFVLNLWSISDIVYFTVTTCNSNNTVRFQMGLWKVCSETQTVVIEEYIQNDRELSSRLGCSNVILGWEVNYDTIAWLRQYELSTLGSMPKVILWLNCSG